MVVGVGLVALAAAGVWYWVGGSSGPAAVVYSVPPLTKEYTNPLYNFSLSMPEDFEATEITDELTGGNTTVLQNQQGEGVQIVVSPFDEDIRELTQERIAQDVPDMTIADTQVVEVGDDYKGLAFKSNNDAFDGASREVWFIFNGHLYQISTYERLDPLLKAIFGTWQFF